MRYQVAKIYTALNIEAKQHEKEEELLKEKEALMKEMKPFFEANDLLVAKVEAKTKAMQYGILAYMVFQWSALARLTWWEYSWDIMEPVTYFITYGTSIAGYAYFLLTRQEYLYPDAADRQRLMIFHKKAKKHRWDVEKYNKIKQDINHVETDLRKLRDPLQIHVPAAKMEDRAAKSGGFFGGITNLRDVINKLQ